LGGVKAKISNEFAITFTAVFGYHNPKGALMDFTVWF